MAHEEASLQHCCSAAAVADACSPHKKMFTDVPSGLHPARTHAVTKARCAPRLRQGLRNPIPAPRAERRGLYLYGTCFPTAASERRRQSATDGIKVDKPLNNARVCTYRGIQTRQTQRTFDPADRLAHGVVEEWPHARKYRGAHILERANRKMGGRSALKMGACVRGRHIRKGKPLNVGGTSLVISSLI